MEIRSILLVEVGARLGVRVYARIASAFIASGVSLFSNPHVGCKKPIGLTDEHRALASKHGDVHTAVKWYLKWCPDQWLPEVHEGSFNILCFLKMHSYLNRYPDDPVVFDPKATNWELRLSVAMAFVFQKNIVCRHGNRCVTCHMDEDSRRLTPTRHLAFLNAEVTISERSVCYKDDEERDSGSWLVYVKTARSPHVIALTTLPTNIAAWFSHFRFRQDKEFDFARAFRCLLEDPNRGASLSKFVDTVVELDSTETMPPSNTEQHRAAPSDAAASTVAVTNQARAVIDMDAPEAPRLACPPCPHALLDRVHEIWKGECDVDTSELVQTLRHIGSSSLDLTDDANSLAEAVMRADAPTHGDTTRKDLIFLLMLLLSGRSEFTKKRRKVKTFVFGLHMETLKKLSGSTRHSPGGRMTLSLEEQEVLLQRALKEDDQEDDDDSEMQGLGNVSAKIASTDVAKTWNEFYGDKARKRLKNARQMIDKERVTLSWVVHDDVIDMVKAQQYQIKGATNQAEAERHAQQIWNEVCFPQEIYRTAQGKEGTQAEFMCEWLLSGYSWAESKTRLKKLSLSIGEKRALPQAFREEAMKRLREVIPTYGRGGDK